MTSGRSGGGVIASTARAAERGLTVTRAFVNQILDSIQLRLRAIEVSRDPQVKRWIDDVRALVQKGEIDRLLKEQPDDPRVLIDGRRS